MFDKPIDLVYCWVDRKDPKYINRHKKHLKIKTNAIITHGLQYNELLYSIRSVEKYASWIRKIFIVTDKQVPKWFKKNEKIIIVDQATILPTKKPCFNTNALESCFYKIPGLSEHWLLASDDYFFGNHVEKSYFFTEDGKPIYSCIKTPLSIFNTDANKWNIEMAIPQVAIMNKYPKHFLFSYTHNITPYRSSHWKYLVEESEYAPSFYATQVSMYRNIYNVCRHLVNLYFWKKNEVKIRRTSWFKEMIILNIKYKWFVSVFKPKLFCLNDNEKNTQKDHKKAEKWLIKMFPDKSICEK